MTALHGLAPLRALAQNWSLIFTAFLPALKIVILLINVSRGIGGLGLCSHVSKIVTACSVGLAR